MTMYLSSSCKKTGAYLSVNVDYGDADTLYPEKIIKLMVNISNKDNLVIRELELHGSYSNSDGKFEIGTILSPEELAYKVKVTAITEDGVFESLCDVVEQDNTITGSMY